MTVTDREMTRYFMMKSEAVTLLIQAGAMSIGGEMYLLDVSEPMKILDLPFRLIFEHRMEPKTVNFHGAKNVIVVRDPGIRPSEKFHEEILIM